MTKKHAKFSSRQRVKDFSLGRISGVRLAVHMNLKHDTKNSTRIQLSFSSDFGTYRICVKQCLLLGGCLRFYCKSQRCKNTTWKQTCQTMRV